MVILKTFIGGKRQWDADARLTVELPVGRHRQERYYCQGNSNYPHYYTCCQGGAATEVKSAKGKAQGEEAIQSDEADDEGRHLTGHQTQKASDFTDGTFFPLNRHTGSIPHCRSDQPPLQWPGRPP